MQNSILKKKVLAFVIFFILIIIGFSSGVQSLIIKEQTTYLKTNLINQYNGTLSGYVRDPSNNSIEGALIRVYFHETYRENYSDSNGYYHVTDIPICYCLKNATCSKEGYKIEWVLLSIYENTTYDFTLYSLGFLYPVFNGTLGWNNWYISSVEVSFVYDPEEVSEIWYNYKEWLNYTEPFIIDEEGVITVEFYWIDYEGVQSPIQSFILKIDYTPPTTGLQWEVYKEGLTWYVIRFKLTAVDSISGMNPHLLIQLNDVLQGEFEVFTWPTFEFEIHWSKIFKHFTFKFICFDNAGNMAYQSINGSDIKPLNVNQRVHSQKFFNSYFQSLVWYFTNLFLNFKR
jgi:hypothetical protein